jgi:hypothetical protein
VTTEVIEAYINAAARIIGDISVGIYRSPANALKELVSNAFDAGATEVFISTDHPAFGSVSCYDNGPGVSIDELRTALGYIGGSNKRLYGDVGCHGRPIIGKIGIGILGMSQISKRFVILSSREGEDFRLEAEVNIEEFESTQAVRTNLGSGKIGRYRIFTIPESPETHYTIIATPAGSETLQANLGPGKSPRDYFVERGRLDAPTFKDFVAGLGDGSPGTPAMIMSGYESFLWELATLCPIPYFDEGPVMDWSGWDHIKRALEDFNFSVVVDGYELRKPILVPTADDLRAKGEDYQVYPFSYRDEDRIGLSFEGYIFHQRKQITPPELQGLLIRIRNVGIGGYDTSMLKYPRSIGTMVRGMTGEVYVDAGLEDALNIDRNSFNETHRHFLKLKEVVFRHLGVPGQLGITNDIRQRSERHQKGVRVDRTWETLRRLARRLERATRQTWEFEADETLDVPLIVVEPGRIKVNLQHDTVPSGTAGRNEFLRVYLASQLLERVGSPSDGAPGLVGWLRKL